MPPETVAMDTAPTPRGIVFRSSTRAALKLIPGRLSRADDSLFLRQFIRNQRSPVITVLQGTAGSDDQ